MSNLYQRRYLKCPYNRARELLAQDLENAAQTGQERTLRLTLAVPAMANTEIGKNVIVAVKSAEDPTHFDQPWQLHWEPESGPYPTFDGMLTIHADETYTTSILQLKGAYKPPLGVIGAAFDNMLGSRIAHETARELLRKIAARIETTYNTQEAAKPAPSLEAK